MLSTVRTRSRRQARQLVSTLRDAALRQFGFWQEHGVHLTPVHFYSPIPDTRTLPRELWSTPSELVGIDMNASAQVELLQGFRADFQLEYEQFPFERPPGPSRFYLDNDFFRTVDAEILYCMIRRFKPATVFEIGSGLTTLLAAQALEKNKLEGHPGRLIALEPHPSEFLRNGFPGLSELRVAAVQDVPLAEFQRLGERDILFIDSTHVLKIGSDVQFEYLEVLPRLKSGVFVHIHDIFLPFEYPREWVLERSWFLNEQYLLQAFLTFNDRFRIVWGGSYMHAYHPELLRQSFRQYARGATPGSFWIQRTS